MDWSRLKEVVADALEAPADDRTVLLEAACAGDPELLREARSLIEAYETSTAVIDPRTDAYLGLGGPDLLSLSGQRIGKYRLTRVIAEGAMAAVYQAQQPDPQRTVALKIFSTNMAVLDAHQRFRREAQALARLQHPNIARIYEASIHKGADGRALPFIAMEFVGGLPLTEHARQKSLSREDRVALLIKVAGAVHSAHQQAVIHRDLKPANVLVDETGEPKVLDFGIARIVGEDLETYTWQTTAGVLLGTPGYMSPEQASGDAHAVDVRSDVWALGVMLYELLVDRLPIDVRGASIAEVLRRIEHAHPPAISSIDKSLKGDIETIVGTAIAPEKSQRYASAQALAEDLQRHLRHEPITARPPTTWYVLRKFARRNRGALAAVSVIAALLVAGAVVSSVGFVRASRQRDLALAAERRTQAVNSFLQQMLAAPDASGGGTRDVTVLQAVKDAESKIAAAFRDDPASEAEVRSAIGWTYYSLGEYARSEEQLRRALELNNAHLGATDRRTLGTGCYLITTLRWLYKPDEAQRLLDQLLPVSRQQLGELDVVTLSLLENEAGLASDRGDFPRAETLYRQLVDRCGESARAGRIAADDPVATSAMNNLANVYIELNRHGEAETMLRALIELRTPKQGISTLSQLVARTNLGHSITWQNRASESEPLLRAVVEDATRVLGPDADNTQLARSSHAYALTQLGRSDEALFIRRDIFERMRRTYGMEHGITVTALHNYGVGLMEAGRGDEAEPLLKQAVEATARVYGADSQAHLQARRTHADALSLAGRTAEAERAFESLLAEMEKRYGPNSPQSTIAMNNLALLRAEHGRANEVEPMLRAALASASQPGSGVDPKWLRRNLGYCLTKLGRFDEAQAELLAAFEQFKSDPNPRANDRTVSRLVELYSAWGKSSEAQRWRATTQPATLPADPVSTGR